MNEVAIQIWAAAAGLSAFGLALSVPAWLMLRLFHLQGLSWREVTQLAPMAGSWWLLRQLLTPSLAIFSICVALALVAVAVA